MKAIRDSAQFSLDRETFGIGRVFIFQCPTVRFFVRFLKWKRGMKPLAYANGMDFSSRVDWNGKIDYSG